MSDVLFLAWRYLAYHKVKSTVLVSAVAVIVYLPVGLNIIVSRSAEELTARADATPLLVGAKGSPLELVLNSLYFQSETPPTLPFAEVRRVEASERGLAIPLYTPFQAENHTIVGTTLEYLDFRDLQLAEGRAFAMLGECVLGSEVAKLTGVAPGGHILSSPESLFDIAGVYPLKMKVVGLLEPTGTPDDRAVFVDVKTTWIIQGLAHGHQDMASPEAAAGVLRTEGRKIIANASVMQYNEITPENASSFHFHGDTDTFPITAVLVIPHDRKSSDLLQGDYLGPDEPAQIVRPIRVIEELLGTIFTVRRYVIAAVVLVGTATLATMVLVFLLSLQLRRREMLTLEKIGGSRLRIRSLVAAEIVSVLLAGLLIAGMLSILTAQYASELTRVFVGMG